MLLEEHQDQIDKPNDPAAEDNAEDSRQNFAFAESRNDSAELCRNGNDRKNHADDVAQSEIIAFLCHNNISFICSVFILPILCRIVKSL